MDLNIKIIPTPDDIRVEDIGDFAAMVTEHPGSVFYEPDGITIFVGQVVDESIIRKKLQPPEIVDRLVILAVSGFRERVLEDLEHIAERDLKENPEVTGKVGNPKRCLPTSKAKLRTLFQKMKEQNRTVSSLSFEESGEYTGFMCFVRTKFTCEALFDELGFTTFVQADE